MTNEELKNAIEKYQEKHPLHFGAMLDVTEVSSKEDADIISQAIERISKEVSKDTDLWCICEMAKLYMQGVKPVYHVRPHGEWIPNYKSQFINPGRHCSLCGKCVQFSENFCPQCGADMRGDDT